MTFLSSQPKPNASQQKTNQIILCNTRASEGKKIADKMYIQLVAIMNIPNFSMYLIRNLNSILSLFSAYICGF